jgi:anthranilate/para-aminobenzoate synthase component II
MVNDYYADQVLKALSEQKNEENEETTAETVVETVEQTTEQKPVVEKPAEETTTELEVNSLFDKLKQVEEPKKAETQEALSEDVQKKLQEYEQYRNQVEQYENNPFIKALTLGKDLKEIAQKIVGNDVSKMSFKEMIAAKVKSEFQLEGEELEEAIEEEMSIFEGKSRLEKARIEKQLREELSVNENEIIKGLQEYETQLKAQQLTPEQIAKNEEVIKANDFVVIDSVAEKLVGGDVYGVEMTKEFIEETKKNYNMNELAPYIDVKTGELNAKDFLFNKFISQNWQKIAENAFEMGKKGTMKRFANPDGSNKGNSPVAEPVDKLKENQKSWGINVKQRVINVD